MCRPEALEEGFPACFLLGIVLGYTVACGVVITYRRGPLSTGVVVQCLTNLR